MKTTQQVRKSVVRGKPQACAKCGGTEFAVGFAGELVLDTAKNEIGIWDTDHMEEVGICTHCFTKVELEDN